MVAYEMSVCHKLFKLKPSCFIDAFFLPTGQHFGDPKHRKRCVRNER